MKQQTKRFVSFLFALLFLTGALVIYFGYIHDTYTKIAQLRSDDASMTNLLAQQNSVLDSIGNLVDAANDPAGEPSRTAITFALPLEEDVPGALAQLYGMAEASKLTFQAVTLSAESVSQHNRAPSGKPKPFVIGASVKPLGVLPFHVKAYGSYESLKSFLNALAASVRLFTVQNLSITSAGKSDQDLYAFDLIVAAYFQTL